MRESSATDRKLAAMFTENTGRHMLDSGDAYGRNWERNAGMTVRDFLSRPAITMRAYDYGHGVELDVTIDAFHFCADALTYAPEYQRVFTRYANDPAHASESWLELVAGYMQKIGAREVYGENTYNGNSLLSQVLQYSEWELPEDRATRAGSERIITLQVHGGADVRGGYSAPGFFYPVDEYALAATADATLFYDLPVSPGQLTIDGSGPRTHGYIYTDDAYHWYDDSTGGAIDRADFTLCDDGTVLYRGYVLHA